MNTPCYLAATLALTCGILIVAPIQNCPADTLKLSSVADAGLFEHDPTNNLGGMAYVVAGTISQGFKSRALYKFDVAGSLPAGAAVTAATLTISAPAQFGAGLNFQLHRVLQDWGEGTGAGMGSGQGAPANAGEVTWNARHHPDMLWNAPGGQAGTDYLAAPSASTTMSSSNLVFSSASMAADVQAWLANNGTNFGWLVIIADELTLRTASHLATRENTVNAPVLTVDYTVPAQPTPPNLFDLALVGNQIRFSFNGESGRTYTVQFRDSLTTGDWDSLTNIPALPANATLHITNGALPGPRFFRARTP